MTEKLDIGFDKIINNYFNRYDLLTDNIDDISSKFLDTLITNYIPKHKLPAYEFDLVLGGGGLKGYYICGAIEILKKMADMDIIKIRKYIGTSIGAILAVYMVCGISLHKMRNGYEFARHNNDKNDLNKILLKIAEEFLPSNAHILCNEKVEIVLAEFSLFGFKEKIINHYDSREHLLQILSATSCIPYLTSSKLFGITINEKLYYDGGFVKNTPIKDNNDIPQLVFKTTSVEYSKIYMFRLIDNYPELLIIRGAIDMEKFIIELSNNKKNKLPIKWIPALTKNTSYLFAYIKYTIFLLTIIIICGVKFIRK